MTAREILEVVLYTQLCENCKHHATILDPNCRGCIYENPKNILKNWQGTDAFLDDVIKRIKATDG